MADKFDPYREALVMETETVWPDAYDAWDFLRREEIARRLHASAEEASQLEYVRVHTGFCRRITVTEADLERLGETAPA
jgi:hypothetical protein